jgi:hypothetical protein
MAFDIPSHHSITVNSLTPLTANIGGIPSHFSSRALDEITQANELTDSEYFPFSAALYHPERHFTNEQFVASTQNLATLRSDVIAKLTAETPDGAGARRSLGTALHTVQDFYAHSNWEELGNGSVNAGVGTASIANPSSTLKACPSNPSQLGPSGGGGLTSGYFVLQSLTGCGGVAAGKCAHGNWVIGSCVGINKDLDAAGAAANHTTESPYHDIAVSIATTATTNFVQSILDELAGNDKALAALLDVKGYIVFVIDTTGSMGDEIGLVQSAVERIVNENASNPSLTPDGWVLVPFNDPSYGPSLTTQSVSTLLTAVNGLTASGGGDCPELAWHGVQLGVAAAAPNSQLFFFSDADSKDGDLSGSVISEAQERNIQLNFFNTGSCSPPDPTFIQAATATGGHFFFLQRSEDGIVDQFINPLLAGNITRVMAQAGTAPASPTALASIPVDSTITQLDVAVTIDQPASMQLIRPSGVPVAPTDPDAKVTTFSVGSFFTISNPAVGQWNVSLAGTGNYSVTADANTPLELRSFAFVQANTDIHGGYFPLQGQTIAGQPALGKAVMLGPYSTAAFTLNDPSGNLLSSLSLAQNYPTAVPTDFIGSVTVPSGPFTVSVKGLDSAGHPYQREYPLNYQAASVQVKPNVTPSPTADMLPLGTAVVVPFTVTNFGAAATFNLTVTDSAGFSPAVSPTSVALATNASQAANVTIMAPTTATPGQLDTLTVTATDAANSASFNSAILPFTTQSAAPIANAGPDQTVACQNPKGASVTLNGSASSSPGGSALTFSWTGVFGTATGPMPTVTFPLGTNTAMLNVKDALGNTGSDSTSITVKDTQPPQGSANLEPILVGQWIGLFKVVFSCRDTCSPTTQSSADIDGIPVTNGQLVVLELTGHDKDVAPTEKQYKLLHLVVIKASAFSMTATCSDPSGNKSLTTVKPAFWSKAK